MENSEFENAKIGDYIACKSDPGTVMYMVTEKGSDWVKLTRSFRYGPTETFTRKEFDSAFCRLNAPVEGNFKITGELQKGAGDIWG